MIWNQGALQVLKAFIHDGVRTSVCRHLDALEAHLGLVVGDLDLSVVKAAWGRMGEVDFTVEIRKIASSIAEFGRQNAWSLLQRLNWTGFL